MSKRGGTRTVIRARVPIPLAETLRAIAEHRGETLAKLMEGALKGFVEEAKKPTEDAQA